MKKFLIFISTLIFAFSLCVLTASAEEDIQPDPEYDDWMSWEDFLYEMNPYSRMAPYVYDYTFWGDYAPVEAPDDEPPIPLFPDLPPYPKLPMSVNEDTSMMGAPFNTETKGNIVGLYTGDMKTEPEDEWFDPIRGETKSGIVGNRVVVEVDPNAPDDGGIWHNPHSGVVCEGCEAVQRIKEAEYDEMMYGLWTWEFPEWWYWYFD